MSNQTLRKSEQILKSYKGAQHILTLNPIIQFVIIGIMGVTGVAIFALLPFQNLILFVLGLVVGVFWFRLFILMLDASLSRQREEARLKKQNEVIELVLKTVVANSENMTKEVLEDFIAKLTTALDNMPEYTNIQTYEPFNEVWKNRIRNLETNDSDKDQTIKDLTQKLAKYEENDGLYMSEIKRLNSEIIMRDELIKKLIPEQSKAETTQKDAQTIKKDNRFDSI